MKVGVHILGLGNVGKALCIFISREKKGILSATGIDIGISSVSDSSGTLVLDCGDGDHDGLERALKAVGAKERSGSLRAAYGGCDGFLPPPASGWHSRDSLRGITAGSPVVMEATPSDYRSPEEATRRLVDLLGDGVAVVTANKAPLALSFARVMDAVHHGGNRPAFLGYTAATGLTSPSVAQLAAATLGSRVQTIEGVLNGTSGYILGEMQKNGLSYEEALKQAQMNGIAEPDPALDVEGWDTAAKLAILSSSLFGVECALGEVDRMGISKLTSEEVEREAGHGRVIRLLGTASMDEDCGRPKLSVAPGALPASHPFFGLSGAEKGIAVSTDLYGTLVIRGGKSGVLTTAAVMVRDMLEQLRLSAWL